MADRPSEIRRVVLRDITAGTVQAVAAQAGYRVCVVALVLSANAAVRAQLQDGTDTLLSLYLPANVPVPLPELSVGWVRTAADQALNLVVLGEAAIVNALIVYRLIPSHVEL